MQDTQPEISTTPITTTTTAAVAAQPTTETTLAAVEVGAITVTPSKTEIEPVVQSEHQPPLRQQQEQQEEHQQEQQESLRLPSLSMLSPSTTMLPSLTNVLKPSQPQQQPQQQQQIATEQNQSLPNVRSLLSTNTDFEAKSESTHPTSTLITQSLQQQPPSTDMVQENKKADTSTQNSTSPPTASAQSTLSSSLQDQQRQNTLPSLPDLQQSINQQQQQISPDLKRSMEQFNESNASTVPAKKPNIEEQPTSATHEGITLQQHQQQLQPRQQQQTLGKSRHSQRGGLGVGHVYCCYKKHCDKHAAGKRLLLTYPFVPFYCKEHFAGVISKLREAIASQLIPLDPKPGTKDKCCCICAGLSNSSTLVSCSDPMCPFSFCRSCITRHLRKESIHDPKVSHIGMDGAKS